MDTTVPQTSAADVVAAVVEDGLPIEPTMEQRIDALGGAIQVLLVGVKDIAATYRGLQKDLLRQLRSRSTGRRGRRGPTDPERVPSGFARPAKLSDELCDFLGLPQGSLMPRTVVTKMINQYIKDNDLQNKEDKRRIVPNEKLRAILRLQENDTSYFQLQTHLKTHFEKVTENAAPEPQAVAA
jgi:chromatin remodeling complex protein RSC6